MSVPCRIPTPKSGITPSRQADTQPGPRTHSRRHPPMAATLETPTLETTPAPPLAGPMDTLCINTIRTLSMDAVQAANSGHPGTPMAMAPVAYTLWNDLLRFDPADPIWPNRDRFVLSIGHASMLLYSLLHLTGVKAVNSQVRAHRRTQRHPRRHQALPPTRQQMPRPPRIPLDIGRRNHHRPAGAGDRNKRRHGNRRANGRPPPSTAPASTCSTTAFTPCAATAT